MRDVSYTKFDKIDPMILTEILTEAGFDLIGISHDEDAKHTTIHLADDEKKDPVPFIRDYEYTDPAKIDWTAEYAKARNADERVEVIAKQIGIIPLTKSEVLSGAIGSTESVADLLTKNIKKRF